MLLKTIRRAILYFTPALGRFLEDFGKKIFTLQAFLVFLTLEMKISTLKLLFRGVLEGAATLC